MRTSTQDETVRGVPTSRHDAEGFPVLPPGHAGAVTMGGDGTRARFQSYTIQEFLEPYLKSFVEEAAGLGALPILDETGLTGRYDFTLAFSSLLRGGHIVGGGETIPAPGASEPSQYPTLFSAVEKQLGLKLVKVPAMPVKTLVIDHIEQKPSDN